MKQRLSPTSSQIPVASVWRRFMAVLLLSVAPAHGALAQSTGSLDSFISPLKNGLNLIMVFGFIAGCVMVMSGFLNASQRYLKFSDISPFPVGGLVGRVQPL